MIDTGIPEELKYKVISILSALFPNEKIYLYGSRARGKHSPKSDIDIAIDGGKLLDRLRIHEARELMHSLITPFSVEVADYYQLPKTYQEDIDTYKTLWKS